MQKAHLEGAALRTSDELFYAPKAFSSTLLPAYCWLLNQCRRKQADY